MILEIRLLLSYPSHRATALHLYRDFEALYKRHHYPENH